MKDRFKTQCFPNSSCLNEDDYYFYVTGSAGERSREDLESHLACCSACREELSGLLKSLHPDEAELQENTPLSNEKVEETLALIQRVSRKDRQSRVPRTLRSPWAAPLAAAVLVAIAGGVLSYTLLSRRKAETFYLQARNALGQTHMPQSPNGLRLDLPFPTGESQRGLPNREEALNSSETLFYQALAVQEDMEEARLGLGFVFLNKREFAKAEREFQRVLEGNKNSTQAILGRAAAFFEEGLTAQDPVQRMNRLESALADFDRLQKEHPELREAVYNKALTLYEVGRHQEAEQEIERYILQDPRSIWSQRLRNLQSKIRTTRSEVFEKEIDRLAREHDAGALQGLARLVPYRMPPAIRSALKRSFERRDASAQDAPVNPASLRWAAETMESTYRSVTGDGSYSRLLEFYAGLSPPEREEKRSLDARLQKAVDLHLKRQLQAAFLATSPLTRDYIKLSDHWELVNLYHLRGNCLYYDRADFKAATIEYRNMLRSAEATGAPDLIAKSLAALSSVYNEQKAYSPALASLLRMKTLASKYGMETWVAYAHHYLGSVYAKLNRPQDSQREHVSALVLARRLGDPQLVVSTLQQLAEILAQQERYYEAKNLYEDALRAMENFAREGNEQPRSAEELWRLSILCKQGYLALEMEDLADAEARFTSVLKSSPAGLWELIARTRIGLAQVFLERGNLEMTDEQVTLSLASIGSRDFPDLEWRARYLNGCVLKLKGDNAGAMVQYERAISALETMRTKIPSGELRQAFLSRRFDPYQEIIALLFHSLGDKKKAAEFIDRTKSMTLRESLVPRPDPLTPRPRANAPGEPGGPRFSLSGNFAAVEYFLARDEIFIFVYHRAGISGFSRKLSRRDLEQRVHLFLESVARGDSGSSDQLSRSLHDDLIGPILAPLQTAKVDNLVVLPDGRLHLLPFGGLKDAGGRYLLEKYAIAYAPSRSVLKLCLSMNRGNADLPRFVLLLDGASNLPGAAQELTHLANLYRERTRLAGADDLKSMKTSLSEYEIIHFSGHAANFEGKPSLVFPAEHGPVYIDAETIGTWRLTNSRLITLAGCNTGTGPLAEGEAPWGLVPALMNAGAPAIITSLMPVDDATTQRLTSRFYELLATRSISKSRALQLAQLSILKESPSEKPRTTLSWLPFVLIGDPR